MLFCPSCANILLIEKTPADFRFFCKTCPYVFRVEQRFENKLKLERKEVDDVMGGEETWKNASKTQILCMNPISCKNNEAYYRQI